MKSKIPFKTIFLYLFFFFFQWGGQLAAAAAAGEGKSSSLFLIPLYLCFILRGFLWLFILRDMKLGLAYSLSSLGYLVIPVLSLTLLGEPFKGNVIPGGFLILAGITLYGIGEQRMALLKRSEP